MVSVYYRDDVTRAAEWHKNAFVGCPSDLLRMTMTQFVYTYIVLFLIILIIISLRLFKPISLWFDLFTPIFVLLRVILVEM